jgi:hypothetical protein
MWFNKKHIILHKPILLDNLHGYVLPHAGTSHTGNIISHTLRFRPAKKFSNILILYLPSQKQPNIKGHFHEYYVPCECLKLVYPKQKYIGYNVLSNRNPDISKLTLDKTLIVVSADFSHQLSLGEAIKKENCAAHSILHKNLSLPCCNVIDDKRTFELLNTLIPKINLQWVGRTRSDGVKGVGYLSFLLRDIPTHTKKKPNGFFVTAYDKNMNQRECLGNITEWSSSIQKELIKDVLRKARTTSRLTGGKNLNVSVTNYTITYLYKDSSKKFIRGWHGILKNAFYLPDVFLENTYDNGKWIASSDISWPQNYKFDLKPTFKKLEQKSGTFRIKNNTNTNNAYQLYYTQCMHIKVLF